MDSWLKYKADLQAKAHSYEKHIVLHSKEGWFWTICGWILFILSFGKVTKEKWNWASVCVANHHFYSPLLNYSSVLDIIPHEATHTRQCSKCSFGIHPIVGFPIFLILYFLIPIPILFAYFRFQLELEAKLTQWSAAGISGQTLLNEVNNFINSICGPFYLWSVPKSFAENRTLKAIVELGLE